LNYGIVGIARKLLLESPHPQSTGTIKSEAYRFLSTGNIVGVIIFTGEEYGVSICRVVTKFEKTVLGGFKLQKKIPQNVELPATLCPKRRIGIS